MPLKLIKFITRALKRVHSSISLEIHVHFFRRTPPNSKHAALTLRRSQPSSDTIPVLDYLLKKQFEKVYLIADDPVIASAFLPLLNNCFGIAEMSIVSSDQEKWEAIANSSVIFWQYDDSVPTCWLAAARIASEKRKIIKLYHGLITKGPEFLKNGTNQPPNKKKPRSNKFPATFSVSQSATECYNRYWLESTRQYSTDNIKNIGYPRFYRAQALLAKLDHARISKEAEYILNTYSEKFKILYAPSRSLEVFDGLKYDWGDIERRLVDIDAYMFVRLHVTKTEKELNQLPKSNRIVFLPFAACAGSLDLLYCMDCLLTDRSSIMMEAIALHKPLIHAIKYDECEMMYENDISFPGYVVSNTKELIDALSKSKNEKQDYACIRKVFNLKRGAEMTSVYDEFLI